METPTKVLSSDTLKKECIRWYKDSVVRESLRTCLFEVKSEDTNDLPALLLLLDNGNDKGLFIFLDKAKDVEKLKDLKANLKASGYRLEVIEDLNEFKNVVIEYLTYYNISTFYDKKDLITDDRKYSSAFELKSEFERHNPDLNEDYKKIMYAILKELVKSRKVRLKLNSTKTPFIPQIQLSIEDILKLAELDNTKENEKLVRDALFALSVYHYQFIYDTIKNDDGSYKKLNYYIAYSCVIFYIEKIYDEDNNIKYYEIEPSAYVLELFKEYFVVYQNQ